MKVLHLYLLMIFLSPFCLHAQKELSDLGLREMSIVYGNDTVQFIVKSKKGEESFPKPIFLFVQGSLPRPLVFRDQKGDLLFGTVPFMLPEELLDIFHMVIISKPAIPIVLDIDLISGNYCSYCYFPENGQAPKFFIEKDYLDYYVNRNNFVIEFLQSQKWVKSNRLVVAGHSQGSSIAIKMAHQSDRVTHVIYSGGNPFGRVMNTLAQNRKLDTDSLVISDQTFSHWQQVVDHPNETDTPKGGDSNKADYSFNEPLMGYLMGVKIPLLVTYGTMDHGCAFNDYFRIEAIRQNNSNITFRAYIGTEHNFFPVDAQGEVDYNVFNWDKVARGWLEWVLDN